MSTPMLPGVLLFLLVAVVAGVWLGPDAALATGAIGIVTGLLLVVFVREPHHRRAGGVIVLYAAFLALAMCLSYSSAVSTGSPDFPDLFGSDGEGYFAEARQIEAGNPLQNAQQLATNYVGLQIVLAYLFRLPVDDLLSGIAFNCMALVASAVILVRVGERLFVKPSTTLIAVVLFCLMTKFVSGAVLLLKEPLLVLAASLSMMAFVKLRDPTTSTYASIGLLALAAVIIGTLRIPMFLMILGLVGLLGRQIVSRGALLGAIGLAVSGAAASFFLGLTQVDFSIAGLQALYLENTVLSNVLQREDVAGGLVQRLLGNYTDLTISQRVGMIPITAALQYILPFNFWSDTFVTTHLAAFFSQNLNLIWLGMLGFVAIYAIWHWQQATDWTLKALLVLGVVLFLLTSLVYGGIIPRYADPYLVLLIPAMAHVLDKVRHDGVLRRQFINFYGLYLLAFGVGGLAYFAIG